MSKKSINSTFVEAVVSCDNAEIIEKLKFGLLDEQEALSSLNSLSSGPRYLSSSQLVSDNCVLYVNFNQTRATLMEDDEIGGV